MRNVLNAALVVALALTTVAAQTTKPAAVTITGKWTVSLQTEAFTSTPTVEFKSQEGEKITGVYTGRYGSYPFEGKLKERALEFSFKMSAEGTDVEMWFAGEVAADAQSMKGRATLTGLGDATWTATRAK